MTVRELRACSSWLSRAASFTCRLHPEDEDEDEDRTPQAQPEASRTHAQVDAAEHNEGLKHGEQIVHGYSASAVRSRAWASAICSISLGLTLSLGPWMRAQLDVLGADEDEVGVGTGLAQLVEERDGATRSNPLEHARVGSQHLLGVFRALPLEGGDARHDTGAVVVSDRRQRFDERDQRIGGSPAEQPGVDGILQRAHLDVAAKPDTEDGVINDEVAHVGHDHAIGSEALGMGGNEGFEVAHRLLLAVEDDRDADGWVAVESRQRRQVDRHTALVIGSAAPVDSAVPLRGLEGLGVPALVLGCGLDVVVAVEQDREFAGRSGDIGPHRGISAGDLLEMRRTPIRPSAATARSAI